MKRYTIFVITENFIGILNRITIIFTRRGINIDALTASESRIPGVHRITIEVTVTEETVIQLVNQIEKIIDVIKAFHHEDSGVVYQELALYKIPVSRLDGGLEKIIRDHHAKIIAAEEAEKCIYCVVDTIDNGFLARDFACLNPGNHF